MASRTFGFGEGGVGGVHGRGNMSAGLGLGGDGEVGVGAGGGELLGQEVAGDVGVAALEQEELY